MDESVQTNEITRDNLTEKVYEGHLVTRFWAMLLRGTAGAINVFIFPAEGLLGFSLHKIDETVYNPLLVIESSWERGRVNLAYRRHCCYSPTNTATCQRICFSVILFVWLVVKWMKRNYLLIPYTTCEFLQTELSHVSSLAFSTIDVLKFGPMQVGINFPPITK